MRTDRLNERGAPTFFGWRALPGQLLLAALLCSGTSAQLVAQSATAAPPPPAAPDRPGQSRGDQVATGDRTVGEDEVVEDIVVVGGDLRIRGRVTGDAVVVGGNLILEGTGVVLGDASVTGGEIMDRGGSVRGEMRTLSGADPEIGAEIADEIEAAFDEADLERQAAQMGDDAESHVMRTMHRGARDRGRGWFDPIRSGFASLISTLALGLVLAGIGAALIFYGRPYLETVSDTLRGSMARSMGVGLAAGFLVIPAFVVMVVALAVSIIGIPLLLVAVPLYPLAVAAALAMGLLAAAHAIGERTAEQQGRSYDRRWSNSYAYLFTGLAMLLAPLVAAGLMEMTGFLDFIGTLLKFVMALVIWVVATAGFGAVILSRAGTRRSFGPPAADPGYASDPLFDDEPSTGPRG